MVLQGKKAWSKLLFLFRWVCLSTIYVGLAYRANNMLLTYRFWNTFNWYIYIWKLKLLLDLHIKTSGILCEISETYFHIKTRVSGFFRHQFALSFYVKKIDKILSQMFQLKFTGAGDSDLLCTCTTFVSRDRWR